MTEQNEGDRPFPARPFIFSTEPCRISETSDLIAKIGIATRRLLLIEPILLGIVLGLIPITLAGLFFAAYMQYRRGNDLGIN